MVAIVTGTGLGLDRSSADVLGERGQNGQIGGSAFNRFGENVFVNAANGNLVIERTDEILIGRGPDSIVTRAYNSENANAGYGASHGWQTNDSRRVYFNSGAGIGATGSTVIRVDADGSDMLYTWDATQSAYICHQGGDAGYRITYDSTNLQWVWRDAEDAVTERYDNTHSGRIVSCTDDYGKALTYAYDSTTGALTTITTDNGDTTQFISSTNGDGTKHLAIFTTTSDGTMTRAFYDYDASGRLSTVTTDLTPSGSSVSDGDKVTTTYTYDSTSDRITKIVQTGGGELDITYDTSNRVHILTQKIAGTRTQVTTLDYDTPAAGTTRITDDAGNQAFLSYDSQGRMTGLAMPQAQNGDAVSAQTISYAYITDGSVKTVTDALGNKTKYTYDANDNLLTIKDPLLNVTTYTYDDHNHVLTMRLPNGNTTRYAYNSQGSLTYVVTADGGVTQFGYDSSGNRTSSVTYRDQTYDMSGLSIDQAIPSSTLDGWVSWLVAGTTDLSTVERVKYQYDTRGGLTHTTTYASCDADGNGISPTTVVDTTFDQFGQLVSTDRTGIANVVQYGHDGLGRLTLTVDLSVGTTTVDWTDSTNSCVVTAQNGVLTTSTYDLMGNLLTTVSSADSSTTTYRYDDLGQLGMAIDATTRATYYLYDAAGRRVADIANDGAMTEYRYDANNNIIATIRYANKLTSSGSGNQMSQLLGISGNPLNPSLSAMRPTADTTNDVWNWRIYDADNRLVQSVDGDGDLIQFDYDDNSNLITTTAYATTVTVSGFKSLTTMPLTKLSTAGLTVANLTRNYYDDEDRLVGTLNGDGYLSQTVYNQAGEVVKSISYATHISTPGSFDSMVASVAGAAADETTRYYYDDRGLLRFTVDAKLQVIEYIYDNTGRVTRTVAYADPIALADTDTLAEVDTAVGSPSGPDRQSFQVYDVNTGKLAYSIDANGGVTKYAYDSGHMGWLVHTTQFVTTRSTTSNPSQSDMDTWATTSGNIKAEDRTTRLVYNPLGELVYTIDGDNYVTEYQYDLAGRKTLEIRYAEIYGSLALDPTQSQVYTATNSHLATAIQTKFEYDADGRLYRTTGDAGSGGIGVITQYDYDAIDRVVKTTVASGTGDAAATTYQYDSANRLVSQTSQIDATTGATTLFAYDAMGRLTQKTDPESNVTKYYYDAVGNLTRVKDALNNNTYFDYDAFNNAIRTTDANGKYSYSFYDALDRKVCDIDRLGYWTTYTYTIGNALASVKRGAAPYTGTITMGVLPTTLPVTPGQDETTTYSYDERDRLTAVSDAMGFSESYGLDAFGERLTVTAKSSDGVTSHTGGQTVYAYNHRGLVTSETLPTLSYMADGTTETATNGHTDVINTFQYDSWGNLTQKIEAVGMTEQRTTTYTYDKLGRLTQTAGDSFSAVSGDHFQTTTTETPTTNYIYDLRGNLIETNDSAGGRTLNWYDLLDRKTAQLTEVDSANNKGALSTWTYDDNGNVLTAQVFGTSITMPSSHGSAPTGSGSSRLTGYTYDALNQVKTQSVASVNYGYYVDGGNYHYQTATVTTLTNTYDATGNLVLQVDGRGAGEYSYYDDDGRKISQVDRNNYITEYTYDGFGNVKQEARFATRYSGTPVVGTQPHVSGSSTVDRVTNFTYDKNNRVLTESRLNVVTATVSGDTVTPATVTSQVVYTYNGLGEVLTKTEATGDSVTYTYDLGGRQTKAVQSGLFSGTYQNTVAMSYDGLGDLTFRNEYALGSGAGFHQTHYYYGTGGRLSSTTDAAGFSQTYYYDKAGRTAMVKYDRVHSDNSTTTEAQVTQYDVLGRAVVQSVMTLSGSTWSWGDQMQTHYDTYGDVDSHSINGVTQQTYEFDALGRAWRENDMGVAKVFLYDQAGAVTCQIDSSSVAMTGSYDLRTISQSDLVALLTNTQAGATGGACAIGEKDIQGLDLTFTERDTLGHDLKTLEPFRQLSVNGSGVYTTATLTAARAYNAFGEIKQQTDENNSVIDYTYNTMGKIVKQELPTVSWTDVDSTVYSARPTTEYYYDASGRQVGTKDANGYYTTRVLLANTGYGGSDAKVVTEYHPDAGHVDNVYDVFYNLAQSSNSGLAATTYTYDAMNRVSTITRPLRTGQSSALVDTYTYDGLGQRLTHYNSQLTSSTRDKTDYDAQGRVVSQTDMQNQTTTTTYEWQAGATTSGLGTFGGWKKTTTIPAIDYAGANYDKFEIDDAAGRIVSKTNMEGDTTAYAYNTAGTVATRNVSLYYYGTGEQATFSYFNTGLESKEVSAYEKLWGDGGYPGHWEHDTTNTITATFSYDKLGNRLTDKEVEANHDSAQLWIWHLNGDDPDTDDPSGSPYVTDWSRVLKDETATYDVLSRMTELKDEGIDDDKNGTGDDETITDITYDKNGNVRSRIASYHALSITGAVASGTTPQSDWYLYDGMNRMLRAKGSMSGGVMSRGTGTDLTYNGAGQRISATTTVSGSTNVEAYNYTEDGYLASVYINTGSGSLKRGDYTYDKMGRQTQTREYNTSGTAIYTANTTYNSNSQMTEQDVFATRSDGSWEWDSVYSYYDDTNNDGTYGNTGDRYEGVVMDVRTTVKKGGVSQPTTDSSYYYYWEDAPVQASETYITGYGGSSPTTYASDYMFDPRLQMTEADIYDGVPRHVAYIRDVDGQILARDTTGVTNAPHERYTIFGGVQMGDVSNDGTSDVDYATSINRNTAAPAGSGFFQNGATTATSYADFDAAYDPINGLDAPGNIGRYTVQSGESLASIAMAIWGDANLWYVLAQANGLTSSSDIPAGSDLIVPANVYGSSNNASTFRVYDPNRAVGNIAPTHPPRPQPNHNCGIFGMILLAVIAVVVSIATYGALTEAGGALAGTLFGSTTAATVAAGAIAGAAGSIVSQGVGLALGIQKSFNWGAVGMAAIGGAVGAGMGPDGINAFGGATDSPILNAALNGAASNAITQGIGVATGLQKSFNWADVAASGISAGVMKWGGDVLQHHFPDMSATMFDFVDGMAGDVAYAATRSLINGSDFGDNMLQGLPSVIGQTIGDMMARGAAQSPPPQRDDGVAVTGLESQPKPDQPSVDLKFKFDKDGHIVILNGDEWLKANLKVPSIQFSGPDGPGDITGLSMDADQFTAWADKASADGSIVIPADSGDGQVKKLTQQDVDAQMAKYERDLKADPHPTAPDTPEDLELDAFMTKIAKPLAELNIVSADPNVDGSKLEKFVTIGRNADGKLVVTSLHILGTNGGSDLMSLVPKGTIAVAHTHKFGDYQTPGGGDFTYLYKTELPSFVIGQTRDTVFEIERNEGRARIRLVTQSATMQPTFGGWEDYRARWGYRLYGGY